MAETSGEYTRYRLLETIRRFALEKLGAEPTVELAYPTVRTYLPDLTIVDR